MSGSNLSSAERKCMREVITVRTSQLIRAMEATKAKNHRLTSRLPGGFVPDYRGVTKGAVNGWLKAALSEAPKQFRPAYTELARGYLLRAKQAVAELKRREAFDAHASRLDAIAERAFERVISKENSRRRAVRVATNAAKVDVAAKLQYQADEMHLDVLTGDSADMRKLRDSLPSGHTVTRMLQAHGFIPEEPVSEPTRLLANGETA